MTELQDELRSYSSYACPGTRAALRPGHKPPQVTRVATTSCKSVVETYRQMLQLDRAVSATASGSKCSVGLHVLSLCNGSCILGSKPVSTD